MNWYKKSNWIFNYSKWRIAFRSLCVTIGGLIGVTILNPGYMPPVYGVLTVFVFFLVLNVVLVMFNLIHDKDESIPKKSIF
ncbi:hypothetical protein E2R51_09440 [Jeotgalibacillus sp. S-D1]|uniref:hypothetical protein n=1 Tax=Jeotgalibacillus sp. S-D1 TaxID=2552189 RepID=UPI00105967F4|nr:hypothetical protein [Jeotgalibacillus sp. S-D1]TDL32879.1 hypothetical protein E2R51_09440 [Jeotgalibacillus sp. S-D1]